LEYLESDMYRQNKPKVLVWQFNEPRMEAGPDAKNDWEAESLMSNDVWLSRVRAAVAK
jgi:alginate O-acetyltransferase complex protein AlgJ